MGGASLDEQLDRVGEEKAHERVEIDEDAVAVAVAIGPQSPAGNDVGGKAKKEDVGEPPGSAATGIEPEEAEEPDRAPEEEAATRAKESAVPGRVEPVEAFADIGINPELAGDKVIVEELRQKPEKNDGDEPEPMTEWWARLLL